jgi:hypothetical protein
VYTSAAFLVSLFGDGGKATGRIALETAGDSAEVTFESAWLYVYINIFIYIYTLTHINTRVHIDMYMYIHIYIYIYIYIHS